MSAVTEMPPPAVTSVPSKVASPERALKLVLPPLLNDDACAVLPCELLLVLSTDTLSSAFTLPASGTLKPLSASLAAAPSNLPLLSAPTAAATMPSSPVSAFTPSDTDTLKVLPVSEYVFCAALTWIFSASTAMSPPACTIVPSSVKSLPALMFTLPPTVTVDTRAVDWSAVL